MLKLQTLRKEERERENSDSHFDEHFQTCKFFFQHGEIHVETCSLYITSFTRDTKTTCQIPNGVFFGLKDTHRAAGGDYQKA